MAQSTNDTFPTAMRLADAADDPRDAARRWSGWREAFEAKGREFDDIVKSGRTHLQDAMPIRLGQEFAAYGLTLRRDADAAAPRQRVAAATWTSAAPRSAPA